MEDNRTKSYTAKYKGSTATVRVNTGAVKRMYFLNITREKIIPGALILATLAAGIAIKSRIMEPNEPVVPTSTSDPVIEGEEQIVENIISNKPNMLYDLRKENYVVTRGDNLSEIAERFGTTVEEIVKENPTKVDKHNGIQVGSTLIITGKFLTDGVDKEIRILESYINDYVLGESTVRKMADAYVEHNMEIGNESSRSYCYAQLLDETKTGSILGLAAKAQIAFNESVQTDETKERYKNILLGIVDAIEESFGPNHICTVISYNDFRNKCLEQIKENQSHYSPYN